MQIKTLVFAIAATALLAGCGKTLPTKPEAQTPGAQVQAPINEPVGIPIKVGETSIKPFLATLGVPSKEAKISDEEIIVVYETNRVGHATTEDKTPVVVVLPANDARLNNLKPKLLVLDLKKTNNDWVVQGLQLGDPEAQAKAKDETSNAKKTQNKAQAKPQAKTAK